MVEMGKELPLAECAFGWGRVFRLYADYLEVNGIPYALSALTRVRPTFRTVMGVSSARLELWFGEKKVLLRGIASTEDARAVLEYLSSWCRQEYSPEQPTWPVSAVQRERGGRKQRTVSLPTVPVPVRLLPGEQAYYSVVAALCGEPIGDAGRVTYPARDQGTLILTNRRIIYIGRKSQVVIDYAHLLRISRLQGAIAVQTDYRSRREIFELRRPQECARYLETILERYEQEICQSEPEYLTGDAKLLPAEKDQAPMFAACPPETLAREDEDESETDSLTNRNWRIERMRTRLRNTEDFQEDWQEQRLVADKGGDDMDRTESAVDMAPDGMADMLSREGEE
jgi:hypothetical protein